ncbi:hypothetical protein C8R46DRAFT_1048769 [Mycena filopes]|nr:hypothetical protein C8R46DRAFT_1048769 [Mycena filopes]
MLALAHASVLSLVVHVSLTAVFLLVFPVAAGRLAGNTSHIYPSSFTPLSADPSSGHGLTTSHITRLPAALGVAGSASLAILVAAATILLYSWVARRAVAAVGVGCGSRERVTSHRLESINLHLTSGEPTSCLLPQQQAFSVLSSLTISMAGADEPQLSEILECFTNAPSLRSLKLRATHASESWLLANFPWSQLTNLNLDLPLLVESVRDFLVQCPTLQVAILPSLVGLNDENITAPLTPVYTLPKLRRLEVASKGDGLLFLLNSISLPALESLSLSTLENPPDAFLAPDLSLSVAALTPTELFSILRPLTATLRTLEIRKCRCITNDLFHDLKDASAGPEPLQLPELTTLTLHVVASLNTLDGDVVADTLDTLASARHRSDAPFPKLRTVGLYGLPYLQSESGQIEHVQRRLTALRRSGIRTLVLRLGRDDKAPAHITASPKDQVRPIVFADKEPEPVVPRSQPTIVDAFSFNPYDFGFTANSPSPKHRIRPIFLKTKNPSQ